MTTKRFFSRIYHTLLRAIAAVACLLFSTGISQAQDLFRKSTLGTTSPGGSESLRLDFMSKGAKGGVGRNIPSWLEAADTFQTFPTRMDFRYYDEDDRELMARRETARMLGSHLEKVLKKSALSDAYDVAAEAVNRTRNLITFAETTEKASSGVSSTEYSSSFGPRKKKIALGLDAFRGFSPTLTVGKNARVVSDHRKGYVLFEWRWGF